MRETFNHRELYENERGFRTLKMVLIAVLAIVSLGVIFIALRKTGGDANDEPGLFD